MNVKKVITAVLAVFVLCAVFCGAVSAFEVKDKAVINPSGSLVSGDFVTGTMQIKVTNGSLTAADKITLDTDLVGESWVVGIYSGNALLTTREPVKPYNYIDGFSLDYPYDLTLNITVTGSVSSNSAGKNINVLKLTATNTEITGVKSASSDAQYVYNSANLNGELSVLGNEIQTLQGRITVYANYGWDVHEAQALLDNASSQYRDAKSAGAADVRTAYEKIEAARTSLKNSATKLALASLSLSLSYTNYTDDIIDLLYEKGWNSEAMLLDTKNSNLKNIYSQQLAVYNTGTLPDAATIDKLAADSIALYNDALVYKDSLDHPFAGIMNYLPFILIGLGAIAVIVVVVVVIIRKRKNSWDELG